MGPDTEQPSYNKPAVAPSALTDGLAAMSLEEVMERMLAMEGAVQRIMVIVATALPHTDGALSDMNAEWGRIIAEIERDHSKAANAKLTSGAHDAPQPEKLTWNTLRA